VEWNDVVPHLTGLAHVATTDADGHPAVAVVSPIVEDGTIWFQTRASSQKARNLVADRGIALMWQPGGEVYVWGEADVIADAAVKARLWPTWNYDAVSFFGAPDDPGVVVVRVTPTRATVLTGGEPGPQRQRWTR